ncbi:MAG: hypothetical protein JWN70_3443 [Planctomycetaceae bacterium]|nr:hypothetical protein [Planctomycetaceae bacterium]
MVTFRSVFSSFLQCLDRNRRHRRLSVSSRMQSLQSIEVLEVRTLLSTFTVNSMEDNNFGEGDSGDLRYIINRANSLHTGTPDQPDLIQFSGVTLTQGLHTIYVGQGSVGAIPLPDITDIVTIDGTTAGGVDSDPSLIVTLDGDRLRGKANGLTLLGGNSTVMALQIVNFPGNGLLVKSSNNKIGGDQVGELNGMPNNPAGRITVPGPDQGTMVPQVLVRPPEGNVISGNGGDGILIIDQANDNMLMGNFVGTDITGLIAQGNRGDGVAIINSDGNRLYGTTPPDDNNPFVFYNVISGNRGNGLVIDDSDNTIIYANFFGLGADNNTPLGNRLNGVLIEGNSDKTRFGLNIPLGNVTAANGRNGVEVKDSASRTLLMNTFGGIAAFHPEAQVANRRSGVLVTSDGGGKFYDGTTLTTVILTCNLSGNDRHGIEIKGNATGVQVSQSVIGLETNGATAQPNQRNGIDVSGKASGIDIGGFEPSVLGGSEFPDEDLAALGAANLISGNLWNGISVRGKVQDVKIINSFIGTNVTNTGVGIANGRNGILVDGTSDVQIGLVLGALPPDGEVETHVDRNIIAFNTEAGILVKRGQGNSILGNSIYNNGGFGIELEGGSIGSLPVPAITSAVVAADGVTSLIGTFNGQANTTYQIEVFANSNVGAGNGQIFLGFVNVLTDSTGLAQIEIAGLINPEPSSDFISATATSPDGTTSEFSNVIQATQPD